LGLLQYPPPNAAKASGSFDIDVNGTIYSITPVTGYTANQSAITSTPWWGSFEKAQAFGFSSLGKYNSGALTFLFSVPTINPTENGYYINGNYGPYLFWAPAELQDDYTYATGTLVPIVPITADDLAQVLAEDNIQVAGPTVTQQLFAINSNPSPNLVAAAATATQDNILTLAFDTELKSQDLINGLNSITAEVYADNQAIGLQYMRNQNNLLLQSAGDNCLKEGAISTGKNWCAFILGGKTVATMSGGTNSSLASFNSATVNSLYGIEWNPNKKWSAGIAYGYGTTNLSNYSLANDSVTGSANSVNIYGVYRPTPKWKIDALFGYTGFSYQGSRYINIDSPLVDPVTATSNFGGSGYTWQADASYDITIPTNSNPNFLHIKPNIGLAYTINQQGNITENGADIFNLNVNGNQSQSFITNIGATIELPIAINKHGGTITPSLNIGWYHNFDANAGNSNISSSFVNLPDAGTTVYQGQNMGANFLNLTGTVYASLSPDLNFYVNGSYEASNVGSSYSYSGGLKYRF